MSRSFLILLVLALGITAYFLARASLATGGRSELGPAFEVLTPVPPDGRWPARVRHRPTDMVFLLVKPGEFVRGSPESEASRNQNEVQFRVTIDSPFYLAETELTVDQLQRIVAAADSAGSQQRDLPAQGVSWHRCQELLLHLNSKHGDGWRLPTESEWEYACRAETTTPFSFGEQIRGGFACYNSRYPYAGGEREERPDEPSPVRSYSPNPWGFYEMHGNLWEWCADEYVEHPEVDESPSREVGGPRVMRGGSFFAHGKRCQSAYRDGYPPSSSGEKYGVRLALSIAP